MRKSILFLVLVLGLLFSAFAQEKKMSAGLGLEFDWHARENFAGGANVSFNYNLPNFFAVGFGATVSSNFAGFNVIEPTVLGRWYFQKKGYTGFFAQLNAGAFIIFEDGDVIPMIDGGLMGGYRVPLGSSLYVEPYLRLGYPFGFGVGVVGGLRF